MKKITDFDNKILKISYLLTNIFIVLLVVCTVALPWMVTWYVETMGRSEKLPAIIMVTCYPCVPFAGAILFCLRRLIKNISKDMLFHTDSVGYFTKISIFCLVISVITIIAGRFYLPFLIMGISFAFFALLVFVFKTVFFHIATEVDKNLDCDKHD